MGKLSALLGLAALAGVGYYAAKKFIEKKNAEKENEHIFEDDSEVFIEEKHSSPKEKAQRAAMFAVGAIKTSTDKIKEGIDDIINNDMVSKGEETFSKTKDAALQAKDKAVDFAKEKGSSIKTEIENIKNKVTSINTTPAEESDPQITELADAIKKDAEEFADKAVDMAEELANGPEARVRELDSGDDAEGIDADENLGGEIIPSAVEEGKEAYDTLHENEEASRANDDIDSVDFNNFGNESIETFDFSNSDNNNDGQPL